LATLAGRVAPFCFDVPRFFWFLVKFVILCSSRVSLRSGILPLKQAFVSVKLDKFQPDPLCRLSKGCSFYEVVTPLTQWFKPLITLWTYLISSPEFLALFWLHFCTLRVGKNRPSLESVTCLPARFRIIHHTPRLAWTSIQPFGIVSSSLYFDSPLVVGT